MDDRSQDRAYEWLRKKAEEWYIEARRELGHSRLTFDAVVLKPICDDCNNFLGRDLVTFVERDQHELVILLPEDVVPEQMRIYDRATKAVYLWPSEGSSESAINCSLCRQKIASFSEGATVSVYEESFLNYFGFADEEQIYEKKLSKKEKKQLLHLYGGCCFECRKPLGQKSATLDHIVAQSKEGPTMSLNLQPLCADCNQKKRDLPVETVRIALDMLLRPAPFESYEDPIW